MRARRCGHRLAARSRPCRIAIGHASAIEPAVHSPSEIVTVADWSRAEGRRHRCELRNVERYPLDPPTGRPAHGVRVHRQQESRRDETRQRHHGQCRHDIGPQGASEQIAHLPLPAPRFGDVEHDQPGEIGELRSYPLEPLPDAADDGNDLRPGVARVRDLPERVDVGLPGDGNQAVAARDLTARWSFVGSRQVVSAVHA